MADLENKQETDTNPNTQQALQGTTAGPSVGRPPPAKTAYDIGKALETKDTPSKAKFDEQGVSPSQLLALQQQARTPKDDKKKQLQAAREKFERAVALEAAKKPEIKEEIDKMCEKAVSALLKMHGDAAAQEAALIKMGTDGRALEGTKPPDINKIKAMLQSGSVREKMMMINNFSESLGGKMMKDELKSDKDKGDGNKKDGGAEELKDQMAKAEAQQKAPGGSSMKMEDLFGSAPRKDAQGKDRKFEEFTDKNVDAYGTRNAKYLDSIKDNPKALANPDARKMLAPIGAAEEKQHAKYVSAKKEDHDTKVPSLPVAQTKAERPDLAPTVRADPKTVDPAKPGGDQEMTRYGESSSMVRSTVSIEEGKKAGYDLSATEIADAEALAKDGEKPTLPWIEGQKANIVKENAPFIENGVAEAMPMKSGISGTTMRFMQTAELMGADPDKAKMCAVAQLQPIEAHSFHEIATAASGFGGKNGAYNTDKPYSGESMGGFTNEELNAIALRETGMTLSQLNDPDVKIDEKDSASGGGTGQTSSAEPPPPSNTGPPGGPPVT